MLLQTELALTLDGARVALDAALRHAEQIGVAVNIAVTDRSGTLLAFARMDGAFAASGAIAQDKAWTVTAFGGTATDDFQQAVATDDAVREGIVGRDRVAAFGGGVPIWVGSSFVGAVGVSGGSATQDKAVATAGADAVVAGITGTALSPCQRIVTERTHHDAVHAASR
jgi:uncharacterized protein GlcG (DUF336 family)